MTATENNPTQNSFRGFRVPESNRQLMGIGGHGIDRFAFFTSVGETKPADNVKDSRKKPLNRIGRILGEAAPPPAPGLEEAQGSVNHRNGIKRNSTSTHSGFKQCDKNPDTLAAPSEPDSVRKAPVRRALCIGIDEYPTAPLFGCVNDARLWAKTFKSLGFDSVNLLDNRQASYADTLAALEQMVVSARPGDALVVQYAGHGTQVEDLDGDEAAQIPPLNALVS